MAPTAEVTATHITIPTITATAAVIRAAVCRAEGVSPVAVPGVAEASSGVDPKKSDFFLEKAWYLRLDNVSIGYTFPAQWFKNKIRSVRLYAAGRNLAVFTPYKGMDPETGNGIGAYPNQSSFAIGLDVKF